MTTEQFTTLEIFDQHPNGRFDALRDGLIDRGYTGVHVGGAVGGKVEVIVAEKINRASLLVALRRCWSDQWRT